MFRENRFKRKMMRGEPAFGVVQSLGAPSVAELLGLSGVDYVLVDGEHGQGGEVTQLGCLQAVSSTNAHSLVRVAWNDRVRLKRTLDLGAEGVMAPDIASAEQAGDLVAACRYPPQGRRGYAASGVRASDYGFQTARYMREVQAELLVVAMVESAAGVEAAPAIAAVEGVDVIQIGANDLSYDLGVPEDFDNRILKQAIAEVEAAARSAGKILGGAPLPGTDMAALIDRGYLMITIGRDASFLASGLTATLERRPGRSGAD